MSAQPEDPNYFPDEVFHQVMLVTTEYLGDHSREVRIPITHSPGIKLESLAALHLDHETDYLEVRRIRRST
jgi:hypothetical protein